MCAKSLQLCLTLCNPIDGSPPGSPVPGILQARTLEWVAIPSPMHESEKSKWSRSVVSDSSQPHGLQPTRLLRPWDFPGKSTGVGCHHLLHWATREAQIFSKLIQILLIIKSPTMWNPHLLANLLLLLSQAIYLIAHQGKKYAFKSFLEPNLCF